MRLEQLDIHMTKKKKKRIQTQTLHLSQNQLKMIIDLNVHLKTPRRKTKENLTDLQCGNDFLDTTQKSMIHERRNWALMLDFIKIKTSL